ncbi:MAG TPA: PP2C family serine/threonine-protein phosphatase [Mycobacteriales bacterium]|nr:PP2C family serine/threonine-protein phosphatase [Mycobacteriales bacterium]
MTLQLRFAIRSDVGLLREGNEDAAYAGPRLLAVADGMGGHAAGEVASAEAIAAIAPLDDDTPGADMISALRAAVETANGRLRDLVARDPALDGMGTTLTALLWAGQRLALVHVGDSRCYLLRDGVLTQITHDHTLVQQFVDEGRISAEEASSHPQRSLITRALDGRGEVELDLSVRESRAGDRYLLCSDGLSGVVSADTMLEALGEPNPNKACERLVDLALRAGGPDNVTCIVGDVIDGDTGNGPLAGPLVAGAAMLESVAPPPPDTSAGRAARATLTRRAAPRHRASDTQPAARPRRRLAIALVAAVLLAAIAGGAVLWTRSQWYVGATAGSAEQVAIFRGVNASLAGLHLYSLAQQTGLPVQALPPFDRQQIADGIPVSGVAAGRRKIGQLTSDACSNLTSQLPLALRTAPTPAPTRTPSARAVTPQPRPTVPPGLKVLFAEAGCALPAGPS